MGARASCGGTNGGWVPQPSQPASHVQRLLQEARPPSLDEVHYVACDFLEESWLARLKGSGLQTCLPTLVVWEGVTMYLPQSELEATLRIVAAFDAPCAVAFDYFSEAY